MDLQRDLMTRILLAALLCLIAVGGYGLRHSHRQTALASRQTAESLASQLQAQLRLRQAGIGMATPFPDFDHWKQHSPNQPGLCVEYQAEDGGNHRSLCIGEQQDLPGWPASFESLYRLLFQPGQPLRLAVANNGRTHGHLTITADADRELSQAWQQTQSLLSLSATTVFAVCGLVFLAIRRALRPVKDIVDGLHRLESGQLQHRLPQFQLKQWRQIAAAANQLAASQQQLLEERQQLIAKLLALQEQERREIAGELHDEFGQCLAAISAVTTSIKQSAGPQSTLLQQDCERIVEINRHMRQAISRMLQKLRPVEWEALGLAASLQALVAGWNRHLGGKTRFSLSLTGPLESIADDQALTLFRTAQECLTNIAKHAVASRAEVEIRVEAEKIRLTVCDDGHANRLPLGKTAGIGLLGIRERAAALGGNLELSLCQPHGLCVVLTLPKPQA